MHVNISLEYYKIFYYVTTCGGITKAAEQLSISQPAVSQALKQLENALGTQLIIRSPKGVRMTAEGELLFKHVSKGYEAIRKGEQQLLEMLDLHSGEIRIGASDMTLQFYLLPYLENFHDKYPSIKVSVTNAPTPDTLDYMEEGQIDFGVVSTPLPKETDAKVYPVKSIQDIFIAGPKFFQLKNRRLDYRELENLPLICLEHNSSTRQYIDEFLKDKNVVLNPEFELATSDIIVQFTLRNLGIGYVMSEFAEPYIKQGLLFPLTFQSPLPKRQFCIVTNKNSRVSTAAQKLLKMLTDE